MKSTSFDNLYRLVLRHENLKTIASKVKLPQTQTHQPITGPYYSHSTHSQPITGQYSSRSINTHTHTRLTALCPWQPGWAGTRKAKPIWILLKQETVSGSGISWAICKSAPLSRQITTPAPYHSVFMGRMPFLPRNQQRQSTESIGWLIPMFPNWQFDAKGNSFSNHSRNRC